MNIATQYVNIQVLSGTFAINAIQKISIQRRAIRNILHVTACVKTSNYNNVYFLSCRQIKFIPSTLIQVNVDTSNCLHLCGFCHSTSSNRFFTHSNSQPTPAIGPSPTDPCAVARQKPLHGNKPRSTDFQ